jgi:hypothetical protein
MFEFHETIFWAKMTNSLAVRATPSLSGLFDALWSKLGSRNFRRGLGCTLVARVVRVTLERQKPQQDLVVALMCASVRGFVC